MTKGGYRAARAANKKLSGQQDFSCKNFLVKMHNYLCKKTKNYFRRMVQFRFRFPKCIFSKCIFEKCNSISICISWLRCISGGGVVGKPSKY